MRVSRHAKNEMRLYRITVEDIEAAMRTPVAAEPDERANRRVSGTTVDGRPMLVVVAGDDPEFVITVFLRS
jgi:hypothetical protein